VSASGGGTVRGAERKALQLLRGTRNEITYRERQVTFCLSINRLLMLLWLSHPPLLPGSGRRLPAAAFANSKLPQSSHESRVTQNVFSPKNCMDEIQ